MSALVASNHRNSAMFPIFFQGVWEPRVPGENAQRTKERSRWTSDTKTVHDGALAILKRLQAPDDPGQEVEPDILTFVNRLSNRDRHEKLPVVSGGLSSIQIRFTNPDSEAHSGVGIVHPDHVLNNEAELTDIPYNAMDVKIQGVALVGIKMGVERVVEIPSRLRVVTDHIENEVIAPLTPFVRR